MSLKIRSLYAVGILTLASCATRVVDTPACGVSHVEANGRGLKVLFGADFNEAPSNGFRVGGLLVNRAGGHVPPKRYAIKSGKLKSQFQLISSSYLELNDGDKAATFYGFGGCSYEVKVDEDGPYLDVNGTAGDLDLSTFVAWYRPGKETGQYWIPGP